MAFSTCIDELIANDKSGLLGKHSSWERVFLRDVASILNGAPFESSRFSASEGFPLIRIRDIFMGKTATFYRGPYEEVYVVQAGELLIGMDGDFNSAYWGGAPALLNQRVCKIVVNERYFSKKFLGYVLPGYLASINVHTPSITVKHLSSKTIGDIMLPLPARTEQERIVVKLEELLSELDAGVAELKAAQKKLVLYRQSLLKAVMEGALTADWRKSNPSQESGEILLKRVLDARRICWEERQLAKFEEQGKLPPSKWKDKYVNPIASDLSGLPALPDGWVWASLDMLGDIAGGVAKGSKYDEKIKVREAPYLRVANVQRGYLDLKEIKTLIASEKEIEELALKAGDVLFNEGGDRDKLGRGWVWRNEIEGCIHQNHVFRMRPYLQDLVSELISFHGNTFGRRWFQNAGKQTTNLASINMKMLRAFPVPVPPALEQREMIARIQEQMDVLNRQEQSINLALKQATAQRQNILRAAFAGQLVPQDPADEPAAVLLERIRAERAGRAAPGRGRKGRGAKAAA